MATSFYDVVVLGADLAATVAGAVLSHRGFRVLVAGAPVEERYSIGPYNLPRAPLAFVKATQGVGFVDPTLPYEAQLIAAHGSLTPAEMEVPLLALRGRR